ncbi:MAG: hypothetical protein ACRDHP_08565 [Ktedonobacterales bacterium]
MMPFDPRDVPFSRAAPYREAETDPRALSLAGVGAEGASAPVEMTLKAESILLEEFNAASVAAYQAKEAGQTLFNLYLLSAGVLATGLGVIVNAYAPAARISLDLLQTVILCIAGILSFALFAKYLEQRQEYADGVRTMETIRELYTQRLRAQMPEIEAALRPRWKGGIPARGGADAIISGTMALLGSLCFAGAMGHELGLVNTPSALSAVLHPLGDASSLVLEAAVCVLALLAHAIYYVRNRPR